MVSFKTFTSWREFERFFGGLKFAVIVILIFASCMIVGTFLESYYGTDFANRAMYKTLPFMMLQALMFLSIILAALIRLPPKKRLYGFYTIHTGLVTVGVGSFITYWAGIDGQITLSPATPTRDIILSEDILVITQEGKGRRVTYDLPHSAFKKDLRDNYDGIELGDFLPFAEGQLEWASPKNQYSPLDLPEHQRSSGAYRIAGPFAAQDVVLSLHPEAQDFQSTTTMGPLSVHYLPAPLAGCFAEKTASGLIVWDAMLGRCFTPESRKVPIKTTGKGTRFLAFKDQDGTAITFFPDLSPYPADVSTQDLRPLQDSPYRLFNKKMFQERPNLFLFGNMAAYYDKGAEQWEVQALKRDQGLQLPWMGFELFQTRNETQSVPVMVPYPVLPVQKDGQLIKGAQRALQVRVQGKPYWVTSTAPLNLLVQGERTEIRLTKRSMRLPFEFVLTNFKMDKDPGTQSPASYESFVRLFTKDGPEEHHIYMNNPMKRDGFTFYQASYFQDEQGNYGSVLSANVDQGRPLKYLGSLLLVLGAIWHYVLNKKIPIPGRGEERS